MLLRSVRLRKIVLGIGLAAVVVGAGASWFYWFVWPRYRTELAPGFSKRGFMAIRAGDTRQRVLSLLGSPLAVQKVPVVGKRRFLRYPPLFRKESILWVHDTVLERWYYSLPAEAKEANWSYHEWIVVLSSDGKVVTKIRKDVVD